MDIITKVCPQCNREFPLIPEFWYKHKLRKDGFRFECKECTKVNAKKWQSENPDKRNKAYQRYRDNNPDKVRESRKKWENNNPEKVREKYRLRYAKNPQRHINNSRLYRERYPDKSKEQRRRWLEKHPDFTRELYRRNPQKNLAIQHRRRALKKSNGGSYTSDQIQNLRLQQNNCCYHCGISFDEKKMHIDHWIPLSKGGSNDISNIKLLCQHCNCTKHNKLPWKWDSRYKPD